MFRSFSALASVVAIVCACVVVVSRTPVAVAADTTSIEAESMKVSPARGSSVIRDSTASGGRALALSRTATASATLTLPASATIIVRAEGQQCSGAPAMAVSVDGTTVATGNVTATSWNNYTASVTTAAGAHSVGISLTNQYSTYRCSRTLYIDTISVTPAAATTTTPAGDLTAAPVADLPGWKHIFADDFTKDAALGSWANASDPNKVVYVGANGQQWLTYPQTYTDTYQHRPYRADQVLSVSNGMLDFYLHNVDGQPAGASPAPLLANGSQYQTYGRYSARLKVDTPTLSEYHIAWLLWPQSEKWPDDGEEDFPEASLASTAQGFAHYALASGGQDYADTGVPFTDWHVYTIEWSPGRVRFILDNTVVLDSTQNVPSKPMRWQLQTETNGTGTNSGHLLVDWVSAWSYTGS